MLRSRGSSLLRAFAALALGGIVSGRPRGGDSPLGGGGGDNPFGGGGFGGGGGGGGDLGSLLGGLFGGGGNAGEPLCKAGTVPVPKLDHHKAMQANGCGPQGMQIPEEFGLFRCCNFHDICFATCGTTHAWCEEEFKECNRRVCNLNPKGPKRKECKKVSKSFSGLTDVFGKGFHDSSQKESCACEKEAAATSKHREFLSGFLQEYDPEEASAAKIDAALQQWKGKEGKLYAALVKKYGHKFIKFDNIAGEFEQNSSIIELPEL